MLRKDLIDMRNDLLEPIYFPVNRFELGYYRNQVIHLFVSEGSVFYINILAIVSIAIYNTIKAGDSLNLQRIPWDKLESDVSFLSQLFRNEFVFESGGVSKNLKKTLEDLAEEEVVKLEEVQSDKIKWVELSQKERKSGRETFDFYCFLLWPFIETYWLSAVSLFTIMPPKGFKDVLWIFEDQFMQRSQFFGKTLYYQSDVSYLESLNKETLKNGISRIKELGILLTCRGTEPPHIPIDSTMETISDILQNYASSNSGSTSWLAVSPLWVTAQDFPDPNPCVESTVKPKEKVLDEEVAQGDLSFTQWSAIEPRGRLWEFCEKLGSFRREGKNRRDTATVANRVLRLASLASIRAKL